MVEQKPNRQSTEGKKRTVLDRTLFIAFIAGLLVCAFIAGTAVMQFKVPPYGLMRDAWRAADSWQELIQIRSESWSPFVWAPDRGRGAGLLRHESDKVLDGYTMYASAHGCAVILLDIEGREVHRWDIPFSKTWPKAPHIERQVADRDIFVRQAHIYPNGDLLACFVTTLDTPWGYGLARFDRNGKTLWRYDDHFHHDFTFGDEGTIYALTHEVRMDGHPDIPALGSPLVDDFVVVLSSDGKLKQKLSIFDAIINSPFRDSLKALCLQQKKGWDFFHNNAVHPIGEAFASHHENIEAGQLMVCLRNLNMLAVVDLETEAVTWAMLGPWHRPHDPDPLDNGRILLFDNQVYHGTAEGSRVIEFDPANSQIHWEYRGDDDNPFDSKFAGREQLLSNGNLLIVDSWAGRLLEVTRGRQIVWEYMNPARGGDSDELVAVITTAVRYSAEQLPFLQDQQNSDEEQR